MKLKIEMILKYESAEARTTHERHRIRLLCQFLKGDNISTWKSLEIQCFSRNFDDYCESSQSINFRLTSKVFTLYKIKYSRRKKVLYQLSCLLTNYLNVCYINLPYQCLQLTPWEFLYNKHAWYLDKVLPKPQPLVCTMKANWKSNWLDFLSSIRNGRSYFSTIFCNESNSIDLIDRFGEQTSTPMGERLFWKFNIVKCFYFFLIK